MRILALILFMCCLSATAQKKKTAATMLHRMAPGDTLLIYQCVVVDPPQEALAADYADPGKGKPCTHTTRVIVTKTTDGFFSRWYGTPLNDFPNRRFSGLKIRERPYWAFREEGTMTLDSSAVALINKMETQGREAMEYDYPITKYTRNQVIFKLGSDFKQLVMDDGTALSSLLQRPASGR